MGMEKLVSGNSEKKKEYDLSVERRNVDEYKNMIIQMLNEVQDVNMVKKIYTIIRRYTITKKTEESR